MKPMPKAYSYLRFSTPEQSKGDSFRRQTDLSREYAKRHGLDLDETLTFNDEGMSAFRGKNVQEGRLAAFLKAVETGKIRSGSYLLVENLDRLSRDTVQSAFLQFTSILERGVNVVTLMDNKVYTSAALNENFGDLMVSLTTMFRAHEESATKSKRLSAAWKAKRERSRAEGRKLTAKCPAWLTLNHERNAFEVKNDRVKVVRRIFEMAIAGHGKSVIERRFNADGVSTFGKSANWHASYIQKILENEAVCGVFQPMRIEISDGKKTRVPDGDPIHNYFPAVINRATFERARRSRASRKILAGRKGENFSNLFSGLAVCANCGAPMHYVNKGAPPKGGVYLVCSDHRRAASNCKARAWRYGAVQNLLIRALEELNYNELFPDLTRDTEVKLHALEDAELEQEAELVRTRKQLDNIADLLIENPNQPTLMARLNTTQAAFGKLTAAFEALKAQIEEERERAKNAEHDFRKVQDGLECLEKAHSTLGPELYDLRSRLHQLLKRTIAAIRMERAPTDGDFVKWAGAITIRFQSTNSGRRLYVAKDWNAAISVPIRDGKENWERASILIRE